MNAVPVKEFGHALDIDLDEPVLDIKALADPRAMAAWRLRRGMSISEQPIDTLPGDLQEELAVAQGRKYRSWMDDDEVNPFTGRR